VTSGQDLNTHDPPPLLTGVVIEVPTAEHLVGPYRQRLDPRAREGIPAHITVLAPFLPSDQIDPGMLERLSRLATSVQPFDFRLVRTSWFGDQVLWLAPEDASPFRSLTDAMVAAFPGCLPYGGAFAEVVPHLTVGESADQAQLRAAEADLRPNLPVTGSATALSVFEEEEPGRYRRTARFELG